MVAVLVILTIAVFLLVDLAVRLALKKAERKRLLLEREAALDIGLKLEFADEARSLKRVEVEKPKARILAVDDEPIVLDSFRKILVLAGYSIDTVETGQEALSLLRQHDYDFVFTDLKMPGLDGLDVTKAAKHLRPSIDVVMITGYATIESAVEAMKYGAMDYVQKPFTENELVELTDKLLIRRQDRIVRQTPPRVRLVTPTVRGSVPENVINVPGGIFVSNEHTWVSVEINGEARVGLDDLVHKTLGAFDAIEFPQKGADVHEGEALFTVRRGDGALTFPTPLSGRITAVNRELGRHLDLIGRRPFDVGWICALDPNNLSSELSALTIGCDAVPWYEAEIRRFQETARNAREARSESLGDDAAPEQQAEPGEPGEPGEVDETYRTWSAFSEFLHPGRAA